MTHDEHLFVLRLREIAKAEGVEWHGSDEQVMAWLRGKIRPATLSDLTVFEGAEPGTTEAMVRQMCEVLSGVGEVDFSWMDGSRVPRKTCDVCGRALPESGYVGLGPATGATRWVHRECAAGFLAGGEAPIPAARELVAPMLNVGFKPNEIGTVESIERLWRNEGRTGVLRDAVGENLTQVPQLAAAFRGARSIKLEGRLDRPRQRDAEIVRDDGRVFKLRVEGVSYDQWMATCVDDDVYAPSRCADTPEAACAALWPALRDLPGEGKA